MENDFELTLEPFGEELSAAEKEELAAKPREKDQEPPEVILTPEEEKMVEEFAARIDLNNSGMVLQYGAGAQKKIADF